MKNQNMRLTIGEFSKFCHVTVKTLKHYEKLGLLVPNEIDEWTRYRYYEVSQMRQLNGILRLKAMGFSLEEIRELFDEGTHKPSITQIEEKIMQVESQIAELQNRLKASHNMADSLKHIEGMERISIQRLPPIIVASHRRILKYRSCLKELCENIIDPELQRIGCKRTQPYYCFDIEHEKEYKPENIDIEYCVQVDEMANDSALIMFKQLIVITINASNLTIITARQYKKRATTNKKNLLDVLSMMENNGIKYWLDGGWGVDILYGRQTRRHRDIDIDIESEQIGKLIRLLQRHGYKTEHNLLPVRIEMYSLKHGYIDIHPLTFCYDGSARQASPDGGYYEIKAEFFSETLFENRVIPCISINGQLKFHSGYKPRNKDKHDINLLKRIVGRERIFRQITS